MFKKMKLTTKLATIIGGVLAVILVILSVSSITMSQSAIRKGIAGELANISNGNAAVVESNFEALNDVKVEIEDYLNRHYQDDMSLHETAAAPVPQEEEAGVPEEAEGDTEADGEEGAIPPANTEKKNAIESQLYPGRSFSLAAQNAEVFMVEMCRTTVKANSNVGAAGVMFEPRKFVKDFDAYGFWIDKSNQADGGVAFSSYEDYSKEDSYRYVIETQKTYISQPYANGEGKMVVAYGIPLVVQNQVAGVLIGNVYLDSFSGVTTSSENYPSMWATIYDNDGDIVWDSETLEDVGRNIKEFTPVQKEYEEVMANMAGNTDFNSTKTREDGKKVTCFYSPIQVGDQTWWALTGLYANDARRSITQTTIWLVVLSVAALVAMAAIITIVLRRMLAPVKDVVKAADTIAAGSLDIQLESDSQDEIGELARAFQTMVIGFRAIIQDVDYLLNEMADGNFNIRSRETDKYIGDFEGILKAIRRINHSLSDTLGQIHQSAEQVSSGSDQVSSGAQALSQGATEQASSVEELAATISEISEQINHNAEASQEASREANRVGEEIQRGNEQMKAMTAAMGEIREKSQEIAKIIKTIEDIAFQTNILALNAAVEAARAGAAGKGFAVVANEVRNLASKSAEASKDTSTLIEGSVKAVENGARIATETAQTLESIVTGAHNIVDAIDRIATASQEQADAVVQVTQGVDQISSVVQTNSATAEESAAASEELSGQANMLKELIGKFRLRDMADTAPSAVADTSFQDNAFVGTTDGYSKY